MPEPSSPPAARTEPQRSTPQHAPVTLRLFMVSATLLMALTTHAQTPPSPTTLAHLRDVYRPLLLFAAGPEDPALLAQLHKLKDAAPALHERDVVVIAIPFNSPPSTDPSLTPADANDARRRFQIHPADFTAILLGKDGGEKLRSTRPLSFQKLRDTIDAMPMRQAETRERSRP